MNPNPPELENGNEEPLAPTQDLSAQLQESIEDVEARKANVAKKNRPVTATEKILQGDRDKPSKAVIPPESKIDDPYLTAKQQADIVNWAMQSGWQVPEELNAWIQKRFKVNSFREVRQSQYAELAKQAKGEAR